uniref:NADH dehydrogenase subunit 3 n=1 Tax=Sigara lateralis TaxID=537456 RepID=UPI00286BF28D|nr:NADH dehydrogenase subunit 3 [Sigara lateralis]WKD80506.1 NADH dehydrogenase subunit 3 [Sigara lateralis]
MLTLIIILMMSTMISMGLMVMCSILAKKSIIDREKMTPFECGFDPNSSPRTPFSIQFFMIAVIFLIFDVEITIMLPMIITMKSTHMMYWYITIMMFIIILMMGLFYEWKNGILEWKN